MESKTLSCPGCGAPLEGPIVAGKSKCSYCGAKVRVDAADDPAPRPSPPTEAQKKLTKKLVIVSIGIFFVGLLAFPPCAMGLARALNPRSFGLVPLTLLIVGIVYFLIRRAKRKQD